MDRTGQLLNFAGRQTSMPERRRAGLWIAGILGAGVMSALIWGFFLGGFRPGKARSTVVLDATTPLPALTEGLREGDARALVILFPRISTQPGMTPKAVTDAEA